MCMQDWRISRLVRSDVIGQVDLNGTLTVLPNRQRVGILVGAAYEDDPNAAGLASIQFDNGAIVTCAMSTGGTGLLKTTDYGDLVQHGFTVLNAGTLGVMVTEFTMPESYLAAGLDQFESEYARVHNRIT